MPVFVQHCDLCGSEFPEGAGQSTLDTVMCPACVERWRRANADDAKGPAPKLPAGDKRPD